MFFELITEVINTDSILPRLHRIIVQSLHEVTHLGLIKLHPVLRDAGLDDFPELGLINDPVSVGVIHLEQERELLLLTLVGELMHGLQELLQRHASAAVLVKQTKCPLHEVYLERVDVWGWGD